MKVAVFERNLMWSSRLVKSLKSLGHDAKVVTEVGAEGHWDAAIVNLSDPSVADLAAQLQEAGVPTIGHAGHKEKDLLTQGREAGVTVVATNSELTFKIESLLQRATDEWNKAGGNAV